MTLGKWQRLHISSITAVLFLGWLSWQPAAVAAEPTKLRRWRNALDKEASTKTAA